MTRRFWFVLVVAVAVFVLLTGHFTLRDHSNGSFFSPPPAPTETEASVIKKQGFPKKIWQSWKDDSENPTERTNGFPHRWRVVNPGWRYERITDATADDYVRENANSSVAEVFLSLDDPILKADFLRYILMLHEGGLWADIDVYPHQPISKWIPEQHKDSVNLVVGIENDHHKQPIWPGSPYSVQLSQYIMLAKPNHPAFKTLVAKVTEDLKMLIERKKDGTLTSFEDVMATTGPFTFTKVMMDYFKEKTGVEHDGKDMDRMPGPRLIGDVLVLPKDSFGWLPQEHTRIKGDPGILVEHLFIGSWREGHPG